MWCRWDPRVRRAGERPGRVHRRVAGQPAAVRAHPRRRTAATSAPGWTGAAARDLDPLTATFVHVNAYARELESTSDARTGRPLTPATVARKLSGLSSWYGFLVKIGAVRGQPGRRRGPAAGGPGPLGHRRAERRRGRRAAGRGGGRRRPGPGAQPGGDRRAGRPRAAGRRGGRAERGRPRATSGATAASGSPARAAPSGGARSTPASTAAVETYLLQRAAPTGIRWTICAGPLFVTASGARLDRHSVFRLVRRLAEPAGHPGLGQAVAALAAARVRHHRPRRGRAAGGRAGRDGARRPAHHPPLRPGPAQPRPRPVLRHLGRPRPPPHAREHRADRRRAAAGPGRGPAAAPSARATAADRVGPAGGAGPGHRGRAAGAAGRARAV